MHYCYSEKSHQRLSSVLHKPTHVCTHLPQYTQRELSKLIKIYKYWGSQLAQQVTALTAKSEDRGSTPEPVQWKEKTSFHSYLLNDTHTHTDTHGRKLKPHSTPTYTHYIIKIALYYVFGSFNEYDDLDKQNYAVVFFVSAFFLFSTKCCRNITQEHFSIPFLWKAQ